jgi:hypothetical protein
MLCPPWDHPKSDREKFNAPLLKSVIDSVVFGHDLDFSNDKSCNDPFKASGDGWDSQRLGTADGMTFITRFITMVYGTYNYS